MAIGINVIKTLGLIVAFISPTLFAQDAYQALDPALNRRIKNAEGRNYLGRIDPNVDPTLKFIRAWIQPVTSPQQKVTAAYMSIGTPVPARIDGIYCPDIEKIVIQENKQKDPRLIPKIETLRFPIQLDRSIPYVLEPGKKRMLLIGLKRPIKEGEKLLFTFQLSSAMYNESTKAIISVEIPIRQQPPMPPQQPQQPDHNAQANSPQSNSRPTQSMYARQAPAPIVPAIPTKPSRASSSSQALSR